MAETFEIRILKVCKSRDGKLIAKGVDIDNPDRKVFVPNYWVIGW
jgi:hypothetical protein